MSFSLRAAIEKAVSIARKHLRLRFAMKFITISMQTNVKNNENYDFKKPAYLKNSYIAFKKIVM